MTKDRKGDYVLFEDVQQGAAEAWQPIDAEAEPAASIRGARMKTHKFRKNGVLGEYVEAETAQELKEALGGMIHIWEKYGPELGARSGKPTTYDKARAALAKANEH